MISLEKFSQQIVTTLTLLQSHAKQAGMIVLCLWGIHLINTLLGRRLNVFGIWPRRIAGFPGILLAPALHADWNHLFFNSIPLFLLIDFMLSLTYFHFWSITVTITLLSGTLIWLFGRNAIHIGASALIMGYWGFLLALAYYQPSGVNIIIALIMLYYLGGLVTNLFPAGEKVSFEGHIFGLVAGIMTAVLYNHL